MNLFKVVVTTVLTTLVVTALGVVAATALWPDTAQAHGMNAVLGYGRHGMHGALTAPGSHCHRLESRHTRMLEAFVTIELGLDDNQEQALQPVIAAVDRWRADAARTCENLSIATAPEGLDTLQQVLSRGERALTEIAPLFNAFYATLNKEQRAGLDRWVAHRNPQHSQE